MSWDLQPVARVLNEEPVFLANLAGWAAQLNTLHSTVEHVSACLSEYHRTGIAHQESTSNLVSALKQAAPSFIVDGTASIDGEPTESPLARFAEVLDTIQQHHSIMLQQTELLVVGQCKKLQGDLARAQAQQKEVEKSKKAFEATRKKFAGSSASTSEIGGTPLAELALRGRKTFDCKRRWQEQTANYVLLMNKVQRSSKFEFLQKVNESFLAQQGYHRQSSSILDGLEPYTSHLHEWLATAAASCSELDRVEGESAQKVASSLAEVYDADVKSLMAAAPTPKPATPVPPAAESGSSKGVGPAGAAAPPVKEPAALEAAPPPQKGFGGAMSAFKRLRQKAKQTIQDTAAGLRDGLKDTMSEISDATRRPAQGEYPADPDVDVAAVIKARLKAHGKQGWLFRKDPKTLLPTWHKEFYAIKDGSLVRIGGNRSSSSSGGGSGSSNAGASVAKGNGALEDAGAKHAVEPAEAEKEELICPLQLSTVRLCKKDSASRPFTFEVISPMNRVMLQACGFRDLDEWKLGLEGGIGKALETGDETYLDQLKTIPGNDKCADCDVQAEVQPTWASINLGIMLCLKCSGGHRSLGVSISQVRSATLDSWSGETIAHMQTIGNVKSNAIYEAYIDQHPESRLADPSQEEANAYIELKYKQKKFASPPADEEPSAAENVEEGEQAAEVAVAGFFNP